ncbi:transcription factor bHLH30-like [Vigna unguiculata]|uniref:Transcription factor MYC2 n=1 Tax=Vigna unguiculata TaxID=3917 RepID=A0A4D6MJD7_VIGUN|nr:transcription factor bHLH30-like [Vigna unguiculata]QCE00722.1 transcription factor MYC2 [Vigna unguiculata]
MLPFRRFYGFQSWLDHDSTHVPNSMIKRAVEFDGARSKAERKSTEACKSHREAERRRRQRINSHLSTLRSLLPNAAKSDKASLLAEVVEHVKRLRKQADEVACGDGGEPGLVPSEAWPLPGDCDEATVSWCEGEANRVKATVCCEDRAGLNRDVTRAIRSVRAKPVRAEMMTVGGRTKSVVVVEWGEEEVEVGALERALKAVVENRALVGLGMGPVVLGQKRGRDCCGSPSSC